MTKPQKRSSRARKTVAKAPVAMTTIVELVTSFLRRPGHLGELGSHFARPGADVGAAVSVERGEDPDHTADDHRVRRSVVFGDAAQEGSVRCDPGVVGQAVPGAGEHLLEHVGHRDAGGEESGKHVTMWPRAASASTCRTRRPPSSSDATTADSGRSTASGSSADSGVVFSSTSWSVIMVSSKVFGRTGQGGLRRPARFAGAGGLEPTTCGFGIRCSTS